MISEHDIKRLISSTSAAMPRVESLMRSGSDLEAMIDADKDLQLSEELLAVALVNAKLKQKRVDKVRRLKKLGRKIRWS